MLKDLTLWHWRFFLRQRVRHERDEKAQHWQQELSAAVESAARWAGGGHAPVIIPEETLSRQSSVRFASLPWREQDGILYSLEARALLDALYIQTGCALPGTAGTEAVSGLKQADWPGERTPAFLGEAVCLTGELSQQATEEEARELALSMLERWFSNPPPQLEVVELPCGFLSDPVEVTEVVWVLLVRDDDQARRQAAELVQRLMPPLLLSWVKGQAIM